MLANIVSILIIFVDKNESLEYYESIFEFKSLNITKINLKDIRYGREPVADIHFFDGVSKEYEKSIVILHKNHIGFRQNLRIILKIRYLFAIL